MALKSLAEEWLILRAYVFGTEPVERVQLEEMQKAFFAGANVVCQMMLEIGEASVPDDVGVAHMESIVKECRRFKDELLRQYAGKN